MTRPPFTLSEQEHAILRRLIEGAPTKEIGAEIECDRAAVLNTIYRIRTRFGVANNEQLVAVLFRRGVLS